MKPRNGNGGAPAAFLIALLLAAAPLAAQPGTRTLAELRALADRNFESLRIQALEIRQTQLSRSIVSAQHLPRVDVTGAYTYVSRTAAIDFAIPGFFSRSIRFGDGNVYDAGISASVPLFNGFRIARTEDMLREQESAASAAWVGSRVELANQVAVQYLLLLVARRSVAILDEQDRYLAEIVSARRALVAQGQALAIDTLQLAARRKQIAVDRTSVEQQRTKVQQQLLLLTGLEAPFDVAEESFAGSPLEQMSVDQLSERAFAGRSELQAMEHAKNAATYAAKAAEGAYYPSIYASGALRYGRPGVDQIKNEWMDYFTAGIRLEWNLFGWGSDRHAVEKQQLEREKTDLKETQLRRQIRTQIATLAEALRLRRETIGLVDQQVLLEKEKQTQMQARLTEGLALAADLVEAETACTASRLRREQAVLEYQLTLTELANAVGQEL